MQIEFHSVLFSYLSCGPDCYISHDSSVSKHSQVDRNEVSPNTTDMFRITRYHTTHAISAAYFTQYDFLH